VLSRFVMRCVEFHEGACVCVTQTKAAPPKLKAQLELHKIGFLLGQVISNRTAPAYKLAKHLSRIMDQYITLYSRYTVTNSVNFANDLTHLKLHENHRVLTQAVYLQATRISHRK